MILRTAMLLLFAVPLLSQISIRNHLEYTRWQDYDRNKLDGPDIFENWTDITYQSKFYQVGLRYEINNPPDPYIYERPGQLKKNELTYRYAEFNYHNLRLTLGNYYAMFGRGLTLRTYEDRSLRVDNNIDGVKVQYDISGFKAQFLSGKIRNSYNRRENNLIGFDYEVTPWRSFLYGFSFLAQNDAGDEIGRLISNRINIGRDFWDFYGEIVHPDNLSRIPSYYLALNGYYSRFTLTVEYKYYRDLLFRNSGGAEYNAGPSGSREHAFTMLNRHPHALNMNNEKGYQVELIYSPADTWELLLNHSFTRSHRDTRIFEEYYAEVHNYFNENLEWRGAFAWNYDLTTRTENITPLIDVSYNLSRKDQLHVNFQHQHTTNPINKSEYDSDLILIEYSRSPFVTLALVGEWTNQNQLRNITMDKNYWIYGNVTFNFWRNQQLSVLYGSRQEGFVCVGGVCRYEPEFEGLEIKLTNRF